MSVASVDSIPRELVQLITSRLLPVDHRSLCSTSISFGQQPCRELITRLAITLPDLRQCRKQQQRRWQGLSHQTQHPAAAASWGLSHVMALTIDSAEPQYNSPKAALGQSIHQPDLVMFLAVVVPTMTALTKLTLSSMRLGNLASAAACLAAACPQLSCVVLRGVASDLHQPELGLADLWPSLAGVRSLRRLKLADGDADWPAVSDEGGLPGLGAITQLQSLSVKSAKVQLAELSQLVGLSKLSVHDILVPTHFGGGAAPHLDHLTLLRRLKTTFSTPVSWPFTACPGLTSLHVRYGDPSLLLSAHTALVRLDLVCHGTVTAAQLQALPALGELRCRGIRMPPAGAGVVLPAMRIIKCIVFQAPLDPHTASPLPAQCVALTFPRLAALKWVCGEENSAPDGELWPISTPAGQLLHLRSCSSVCLQLSRAFAHCAVAVQQVVIKATKSYDPDEDLEADEQLLSALLLLGPRLRWVELRDTRVTDAQLIKLAASWPLVEEVTLRGVSSKVETVTDAGLSALLRLPHLRRVTLSSCSAVTPSAIVALASRWCIERIEVCDCKLVGAADVLHILSLLGRPQLDIVHSKLVKEVPRWRDGLNM